MNDISFRQQIVRNSKDPTFVFLAILWSTFYAWDEALEALCAHFSLLVRKYCSNGLCWYIYHFFAQESRVITTNDVALTYELHVIRAHLLHYTSLLRDFRKSVEFVRDTANPAMDSEDIDDATCDSDKELLNSECGNLLSEIHRLELSRDGVDDRVHNLQNLVGSDCEHFHPNYWSYCLSRYIQVSISRIAGPWSGFLTSPWCFYQHHSYR